MKILFVLHDLSLTGAPKLGLQIATVFAETHNVTLVSKKAGPLSEQIDRSKIKDVIITDTSHEIKDSPVNDRVDSAVELIKTKKPDLIYVNSIAAADWVLAAVETNTRVVLHTHEMSKEIMSLLRRRIFRPEDIHRADYIVAASEECLKDAIDIFRLDVSKSENFSVCVDIDAVRQSAAMDMPFLPKRHDGQALGFDKKIVAMCGLACLRKGSDIFYTAAKLMPEIDFLWVGPWDDKAAINANTALALNEGAPLDNLYWTNTTANPYAFIARSDFFFLTSREDPNPLVVPEALLLNLPTASFTACGGSHEWTRRFGFALSGETDTLRMVAFLKRYFATASYRHDRSYTKDLLPLLDLRTKAKGLLDTIIKTAA
ncbi:glycosyltransferase [Asticcacaulis sp. AC466]|uniref:glycosyltransferase n=1 Tax=Asticcacaulis sp. AC466 TaxID=1282362 RepID=UPI000404BBAE|nr:glycosyltransferase [Asticcacaulis sp. AC466]